MANRRGEMRRMRHVMVDCGVHGAYVSCRRPAHAAGRAARRRSSNRHAAGRRDRDRRFGAVFEQRQQYRAAGHQVDHCAQPAGAGCGAECSTARLPELRRVQRCWLGARARRNRRWRWPDADTGPISAAVPDRRTQPEPAGRGNPGSAECVEQWRSGTSSEDHRSSNAACGLKQLSHRLQRGRDIRCIQPQFEQPHVPEAEIRRRWLDRCNRAVSK